MKIFDCTTFYNEKMMMARMAKKSDIGGYGCARNLDFGGQGGEGRRAKPLLQGSWEERDWKE